MDLCLVFPHQLFEHHPAIQPGRAVALIEDPLLFGCDPTWPMQVHRQRLLLHRASMNAYAGMLEAKGLTVLRVLQGQATSTTEILADLVDQGTAAFTWQIRWTTCSRNGSRPSHRGINAAWRSSPPRCCSPLLR